MSKSYKKIFVVNSLAGWGSKIFQILCMLILTPLLLSGLGKERYGAWILVGQLAAYLMMLDLGVSSSIARYYARHMAEEDILSNKHLYSTATFILSSVGFVVILISWFARNYVAYFYEVEASIYRDFTVALVLSGLCLAVTLPFRVFMGILQAYHKLYYVDLSIFISSLVKFIGIIYLNYFWHWSLTNLAYILLVSEFSKYLLMSVFVKHLSGAVTNFSFEYVSWKMTSKIYSLGIASFFSSLLKTVRQQAPITLVGKVFGLGMVPVISIPLSVLRNVGALIGRIGTVFTAVSSELDAVGKKDRIASLNIEVTRLLLSVTFAGALLIVFFSQSVLSLWLRDNIDKNSLVLISKSLSILVMPYFIYVSMTGLSNTLMATGHHFRIVTATAVIILICFPFFFVFMDNVINVSYIISVTLLIMSFYLVYQFSCYLDKSFRYVFGSIFYRPLCFGMLLVLSFWPIRRFLGSELIEILFFCVMAIVYFALTVEQKHRGLILTTLGFSRYGQNNAESP